jgi:Tfp pilus assembly protein PilX
MMVMAVLLLAGTTFLTISSTESQIAWNERAATQALLVAEAALARAAAQLSVNPSYSGETGIAVPGGTAASR